MEKITLKIELEYDPEYWYGPFIDAERWFLKSVLGGPLMLRSKETGEDIGKARLLEVVK